MNYSSPLLPLCLAAAFRVLTGTATAPPNPVPTGTADPVLAAAEGIDEPEVRGHLYFLASDALQGRDTPSPSLDLAAAYIASQFEALGLEPAAEEDFFQTVDLEMSSTEQASAQFTLRVADSAFDLEFPADSLQVSGATASPTDFAAEGLVVIPSFFGEGIPADVALKGRVLVLIQPAAEADPSERSFWSMLARSPFLLSRVPVQTGARGIVLVTQPGDRGEEYFDKVLAQSSRARIGSDGRRDAPPIVVTRQEGLLTSLADALGIDVARLEDGSAAPAELAGELQGRSARLERRSQRAFNVAGLLPGSDPELASQTVLISAHYDHLGVGDEVNGDAIYNGADDDASGTTAVLVLARAFAGLRPAPRRSILFVAFCAEEKGLLGSRHYAESPLVPLAETVANVNIEMIGRPDDIGPDRAWVTGFEYSEVGGILAAAAAPLGFEIYRHDSLSERLFGASDNASLAAKGVPAHSLSAGSLHADYHQTSDNPDTLDTANMTRTIRALFVGIHALCERDEPPHWDASTTVGARSARLRSP